MNSSCSGINSIEFRVRGTGRGGRVRLLDCMFVGGRQVQLQSGREEEGKVPRDLAIQMSFCHLSLGRGPFRLTFWSLLV